MTKQHNSRAIKKIIKYSTPSLQRRITVDLHQLLALLEEGRNRETTNYNGRVVINLLDADPVEEVQVVAAVPVPEPIADDAFDVKLQAGGEVAM